MLGTRTDGSLERRGHSVELARLFGSVDRRGTTSENSLLSHTLQLHCCGQLPAEPREKEVQDAGVSREEHQVPPLGGAPTTDINYIVQNVPKVLEPPAFHRVDGGGPPGSVSSTLFPTHSYPTVSFLPKWRCDGGI